MQKIDDGGPAFPGPWQNPGDRNAFAPDGQLVPPEGLAHLPGLSLRDYFAALVLSGLVVGVQGHHMEQAGLANLARAGADVAYAFADAMLAARRK